MTKRLLEAHFDGACTPMNPGGTATYGAHVVDRFVAKVIYEGKGVVCEGPGATNNIAEYAGFIKVLEWLAQLEEPSETKIYGDSKLVLMQVTGAWRINAPHLLKLCNEAREKLKALHAKGHQITLEWVPRELNTHADRLSKLAYTEATGLPPPPDSVHRKKKDGTTS